jgi:hypothetical protein
VPFFQIKRPQGPSNANLNLRFGWRGVCECKIRDMQAPIVKTSSGVFLDTITLP